MGVDGVMVCVGNVCVGVSFVSVAWGVWGVVCGGGGWGVGGGGWVRGGGAMSCRAGRKLNMLVDVFRNSDRHQTTLQLRCVSVETLQPPSTN